MKKLFCIILSFLLLVANVGQAQFNDSEPMFGQQLNLGHWSTDGLVFYWRGIEAGNAVDESFYHNNGTITGATWVGDALSFDGNDKAVANSVVSAIFSVSVWVKTTSADDIVVVSDWDGSNRITIEFDGGVRAFVTSTNSYFERFDGLSLDDGLWHNYAYSWDGTDIAFYIDGQIQTPFLNDDPSNMTTQSLFIGARGVGAGDRFFVGEIRDVKIYNRALSASEIADLYIQPDLPMQQEPIWLMFSPVVGGSLQWILDGGIGPSPLKGSVVR